MKIFLFFISFMFLGLCGFAQSTTPRFGTTPSQDNTGRVLTYKYGVITDASGVDSISIAPNAWQTIYKVTLVDTLTLKQPNIAASYVGDNILIIVTAASGTPRLKFAGTNWITTGPATLSTGLRAVIRLVFDGSKWVESGRVVQ